MKNLFFGIIASLVLLSSCTIERLYCGDVLSKRQDGDSYYIEIFHDGTTSRTFKVTRNTFNSAAKGVPICIN